MCLALKEKFYDWSFFQNIYLFNIFTLLTFCFLNWFTTPCFNAIRQHNLNSICVGWTIYLPHHDALLESRRFFNPRKYKGGGGGGWHPPNKVFQIFFLEDKTSAPDVFSSCLFIPCADFEMNLVMVSCYQKMVTRYDVISSWWSRHFWVKIHVFLNLFQQ